MSVEEAFLVHGYCPGLLKLEYRSRSLAEILETNYGLRWLRARQTIRAVAATRELAALLSIPVRSPMLYTERISFSEQDVPVELLRAHHRGDRYALHGELRR
jgi:GntR family transcriptional regulator